MVALGALCRLFGADREQLRTLAGKRYESKGPEICERNLNAFDSGFREALGININADFSLSDLKPAGENYMLISVV